VVKGSDIEKKRAVCDVAVEKLNGRAVQILFNGLVTTHMTGVEGKDRSRELIRSEGQ